MDLSRIKMNNTENSPCKKARCQEPEMDVVKEEQVEETTGVLAKNELDSELDKECKVSILDVGIKTEHEEEDCKKEDSTTCNDKPPSSDVTVNLEAGFQAESKSSLGLQIIRLGKPAGVKLDTNANVSVGNSMSVQSNVNGDESLSSIQDVTTIIDVVDIDKDTGQPKPGMVKERFFFKGKIDETAAIQIVSERSNVLRNGKTIDANLETPFCGKAQQSQDLSLTDQPLQRSVNISSESALPLQLSCESGRRTCYCVLDSLRELPFHDRTISERKSIVSKGRPTPKGILLWPTKLRKKVNGFQNDWYTKNKWLCACLGTGKLYCWPCLLFSDVKSIFTTGVDELQNFTHLQKRHVYSQDHIFCFSSLMKFGKSKIVRDLNMNIANTAERNDRVRSNRYILTKLTDIICFLGKYEKTLFGYGEGDNNYIQILDFMSKIDDVLAFHLRNTSISALGSTNFQKDLIEAVNLTIKNKIKEEIARSNFVTLILNKSKDATKNYLLSTVVRYVTDEVHERLFQLEIVDEHQSPSSILQMIRKTLKDLDCDSKAICLSYNALGVGALKTLKMFIENKVPIDIFVQHSYKENVMLILERSLHSIDSSKIFFETWQFLVSFLCASPRRLCAFESVVQKHLCSELSKDWIFSTNAISDTAYFIDDVLNLFEEMSDKKDIKWDFETKITAKGLLSMLKQRGFRTFLKLFKEILPRLEVVFKVFNENLYDCAFCKMEVDIFLKEMESLRVFLTPQWLTNDPDDLPTVEDNFYYLCSLEIIGIVKDLVEERFANMSDLVFLRLLDFEKFNEMRTVHPSAEFESLSSFIRGFDIPKLKLELQVVYEDDDMRFPSLYQFYDYLKSSNLDLALPQVMKLAEAFLCILPCHKNNDNAMSRQHMFLKSENGRNGRYNLGLINVENEFLDKVSKDSNFYSLIFTELKKLSSYKLELNFK